MHSGPLALSDTQFDWLRSLVSEHIGIDLTDSKRELVHGRLARRLRQLRLESFEQYYELLRDGNSDEFQHFINTITTNLTAFFRERHHFDYLAETLLPNLMARKTTSRRLRIWSAGCSSGEEAYSIAVVLRAAVPHLDGWNAKILATDIDSNVLASGKEGIYGEESVADIPPSWLKHGFQRGTGRQSGKVRVRPEIRELVTFHQLNLTGTWPMRGPFDFIFCRNVVIYFDKETQRLLFDRLANLLPPGGYLFVGHSESLFKLSGRFRSVGKTIYQRTA